MSGTIFLLAQLSRAVILKRLTLLLPKSKSTLSLLSFSLDLPFLTPFFHSLFFENRHHVFLKTSHREVSLAEVGPRFDMRPYEIRQGTLEQKASQVEWQLRNFMRSAKKNAM